jgi:predicted AlkP superfamily pyrophosphatase or phosphodiesterase
MISRGFFTSLNLNVPKVASPPPSTVFFREPMRIKHLLLPAFFVLLSTTFASAVSRVMIVSIDGLRPDVALRADMPNLRWLMNNGSFTFFASTTPAAITLPSHTSMVTGVTIERHGISGNDDKAANTEKLLVPTIFDLAKKAGISTGMSAGKTKFLLYTKSGAMDYFWYPQNDGKFSVSSGTDVVHDSVVADHAIEIIRAHAPRLLFVHFPWNDVIGHAIGWGSTEQVTGLADTDKQLGRIMDALREAKVFDQTTIILSADHGGSGRTHGAKDEESHYIPWIIEGPNVRHDYDLSLVRPLRVRTYDTFATACWVLGLTPAADIDGEVVKQAFVQKELLAPAAK